MIQIAQEIQMGDIFAMRRDYFDTHPTDPWFFFAEGIALGEEILEGEEEYTHIAVADSPSTTRTVKTLEEMGNGLDQYQRNLGPAFDIIRPNWIDPSHPELFVRGLKAKLGTPYDYKQLPLIFLARATRDLNLAPNETNRFVCSTVTAKEIIQLGYNPWPSLKSSVITPTDYKKALEMTVVNVKGQWITN